LAIHVRDARSGDEHTIVNLLRDLAEATGGETQITDEYVRSYLSHPGSYILLSEAEDHVVGLLSYSVRPGLYHAACSGLIEELVVRRSARGQGVGSALIAEVLRRLEALGCAEVSVSTLSDNEGALRFYRSHGLVDEAILLEKHF
jgi:ribosomal protein S18 acetylase RimI-like enzyme